MIALFFFLTNKATSKEQNIVGIREEFITGRIQSDLAENLGMSANCITFPLTYSAKIGGMFRFLPVSSFEAVD